MLRDARCEPSFLQPNTATDMSMGNESSSESSSSSDNPNAEIVNILKENFEQTPKKAEQAPFIWEKIPPNEDFDVEHLHWAKESRGFGTRSDLPVRYANRWYELNLPDDVITTCSGQYDVVIWDEAVKRNEIIVKNKKNQIQFESALLSSVPCNGDYLIGCLVLSSHIPSVGDYYAYFALKRPRSLKKVSQKRDTSPKRTIPGVGKLVKEPKPPKAPKKSKSDKSKSKKSKLGEPIALELPLGPEIPIEPAIGPAVDPAVGPAVEPAGITTTPLHQLQDDFLQILIDTFSEIKARYRRKAPENVRLPPGL